MPTTDPELLQAKQARRNAVRRQPLVQVNNQAGPSRIQLPPSTNPRTLSQILGPTPITTPQTPHTPQSGERRSRIVGTPTSRGEGSKRRNQRPTPPSLTSVNDMDEDEMQVDNPQQRLFQEEIASLPQNIHDVFDIPEEVVGDIHMQPPDPLPQMPNPPATTQLPLPPQSPPQPNIGYLPARMVQNVRHANARPIPPPKTA